MYDPTNYRPVSLTCICCKSLEHILVSRIMQQLSNHCLCWGLTTRLPLWVILCRLPEKGGKEIEEIVEKMKGRGKKERGTGMKVKKQKK